MAEPERRCPCKSGRKYKRCCQPWHQGRPAPSPQALMRSRFSAYALGLVDYIVATTDPAGPMWQADRARWEAEIRDFCERTRFRELKILDTAEADHVSFSCVLAVGEEQAEVGERSRFTQVDGRWLYHSGERA